MDNIKIVEIEDINDDLLLPWLDLYEISFPPEEKVLVSDHLSKLKKKAAGLAPETIFLAAVDKSGSLLAIMRYRILILREHTTLHLWYLGVQPDVRNKGIGGFCYDAVCDRARSAGAMSVIFEVEIPELAATKEAKRSAERRIDFYRRRGALMLDGIKYTQNIGPHQPSIQMHIMIHPFGSMNAEETFLLAKSVFEDALIQTGPLVLE